MLAAVNVLLSIHPNGVANEPAETLCVAPNSEHFPCHSMYSVVEIILAVLSWQRKKRG